MSDQNQIYYERHAQPYIERTQRRIEFDLLGAFTSMLPTNARVIDAGCGSGKDMTWFKRHPKRFKIKGLDSNPAFVEHARKESGCEVVQADIRLHTLEKDALQGIWANRLLPHFPPMICQRVLGGFFAGLEKNGVLMVNFISGEHGSAFSPEQDQASANNDAPRRTLYRFAEPEFASLLLQSGFVLKNRAEQKSADELWVTYFCVRI